MSVMNPPSCSPKNDILVGVSPRRALALAAQRGLSLSAPAAAWLSGAASRPPSLASGLHAVASAVHEESASQRSRWEAQGLGARHLLWWTEGGALREAPADQLPATAAAEAAAAAAVAAQAVQAAAAAITTLAASAVEARLAGDGTSGVPLRAIMDASQTMWGASDPTCDQWLDGMQRMSSPSASSVSSPMATVR